MTELLTPEPDSVPQLTPEQFAKLKALHHLVKYRKFEFFRPYKKQLLFFEGGKYFNQRMLSAGNQLGKSEAGAYETMLHLTGLYPDWWVGHRFVKPIQAWAVGLDANITRDVVQAKLCGPPNVADGLGTGFIPLEYFAASPTLGRGVTGAFDMIQITHHDPTGKPDGTSTLKFKSYEQGWEKFQSATIDWIWLDEEPDDQLIYPECLTRTVATHGKICITFTPLKGETPLYSSFYKQSRPETKDDDDKLFVSMTADEVMQEPHSHLDPVEYEKLYRSWPAYLRKAKRLGLPVYGVGSVFEYEPSQISYKPWPMHATPGHLRMCWGMDFGGHGKYAHPFGAVLGMWDPITDTIYITCGVRTQGQAVLTNAQRMRQICAAAPAAWPHDGVRHDGGDPNKSTADMYRDYGVRMWHTWATHGDGTEGGYATETGILAMQQMFEDGRLKVSEDFKEWFDEFRIYHRDKNGEIVRDKDDLMSATRILVMMIKKIGQTVPMGYLGGSTWKDFVRRQNTGPREGLSRGLDDYDIWDP